MTFKIDRTFSVSLLLGFCICASACFVPGSEAKHPPKTAAPSFKREEKIILNLTQAPKSAKWYIMTALKTTKENEHGLDKALHQVSSADATFAKTRHHPDDRTMTATTARLQAALQTAQQLEQQLLAANEELKGDVQNTLVAPK